MDLILDSILEDAFDDIVDDAIEDGEVDATSDGEEEMYEVPVDTPEEYEDPYIMYSDDEDDGENDYEDGSTYEVGATDEDNDLDAVIADLDARIAGEDPEEDEEDIFVQESASMKGDNFFSLEDSNAILDDLDAYLSESYFLNNTITFDNKLFTEATEGKMSFFEKIKKAIEWLWEQIQRAYKTIKTKIINFLNGNTDFLKKIKDFPKFVKSKKNTNESALYVTEAKKQQPANTTLNNNGNKNNDKKEKEKLKEIEKHKDWKADFERSDANNNYKRRMSTIKDLKSQNKNVELSLAKETSLMWTFVESGDRRKAIIYKLYNHMITTQDLDNFGDADITDDTESKSMARTAKYFDININGDETLIEHIEKQTKNTYFANGLPKSMYYVDLINKVDEVCNQFKELYEFSSKVFNELEINMSKTEKAYNTHLKHYEKIFKDFAIGKAYEKDYKDDDDLGYKYNTLTKPVASTYEKNNDSVNNSKNIAIVHHRLEVLKTVCSNHINLIRAHIRALTECTSTEFRFTKHAINIMMITEGYGRDRRTQKAFDKMPSI